MKLSRLLVALCIALFCLCFGMAKPSRGPGRGGRDSKRTRGAKRTRMLQKILKRITPEEILQLARSKNKKDRKYGDFDDYDLYRGRYLNPGPPTIQRQIPRPEIECPHEEEGELFPCPSPDDFGLYTCIGDHAVCDNKIQCPNGEDENATVCMFHKITMHFFKSIMLAATGISRSPRSS